VLSKKVIKEIVKIQVDVVKKRLEDKEIDLVLADDVLDLLSEEGYKPEFGARPLKRLIQTKILNPLATMMIGNKIPSGATVYIARSGDEFTFDMKKGKRATPLKIPRHAAPAK
jgi:ATP-dependent Clp protease ATP-binding subunit ClpB